VSQECFRISLLTKVTVSFVTRHNKRVLLNLSSWRRPTLPALVLSQEGVAVAAIVLGHVKPRGTEGDESAGDTHSDDAETGAECPGQHTGPSLGDSPDMVLAVYTGQVHRVVTEVCGHDQLGGHWGRGLVDWPDVVAPCRWGVGSDGVVTVLGQALSVSEVMMSHRSTQGDAVTIV